MAKIVLGVGSSHSPQVSSPSEVWPLHAQRDRENPDTQYEQREFQYANVLAPQLRPEVWQRKYEQCQMAIDHLQSVIAQVSPDVIVVIGDDQEELFWDEVKPAFAVYWGDEIVDLPHRLEDLHPSLRPVIWAWHTTDEPVRYRTESNLGKHILLCMTEERFDVAQSRTQLRDRSLGHAYTFVKRRLVPQDIPMVPVFINCFFQPNQPTPARCYEFGQALRRAIESWDADLRVAVIGSGGLSHFKLDESLDELVIRGLQSKDASILKALPRDRLEGASGEILNWIAAAGAVEHLQLEYLEYVSGYRSPAGTGVGMTFAIWR
ncbi:3-O-methylgallate 3,4-dioxygenase [Alicyclobacillus hesperidum]|uniref:3-O-methylgallate 3,4-dioxygenase n=1 Tax=Alicyclobacillus hesperidum TaxID=89784 RepID=A0A1H2RII7_9BACL|nr:hypothetical protein [Alicyclobacillus hesperidum]SDW19292.1 3-O-methylgallate 3,4-dioxygenase [Alicyclobacillus hesperidum]